MASKPCARCAAKSCTCGLPRRRPTDSERLTWLLGGGLVGWGRRVAFFNIDRPTRRDFDRLMREEAKK